MQLKSPVFDNGQYLPVDYTSEGSGISPSLTWGGVPAETRSFALIMKDLDIPSPKLQLATFVHWVVYNLPSDKTALPANFTALTSMDCGAVVGRNGAGFRGYYPPCPVSGTHEYVFQLFALDVPQIIPENDTADSILNAVSSHVLENSELIGLYRCTKFTRWQALRWNLSAGQNKPKNN